MTMWDTIKSCAGSPALLRMAEDAETSDEHTRRKTAVAMEARARYPMTPEYQPGPWEDLSGAFELIDMSLIESCGMFATRADAHDYANTYGVRAFELWRDDELIEERKQKQ